MPKPLLSKDQITSYLMTVKGWQQQDNTIIRSIETKSFSKGVRILEKIEPLANEINHHPDVLVTYPRITITITTHDSGGITELDFQLAEKIDTILPETE